MDEGKENRIAQALLVGMNKNRVAQEDTLASSVKFTANLSCNTESYAYVYLPDQRAGSGAQTPQSPRGSFYKIRNTVYFHSLMTGMHVSRI